MVKQSVGRSGNGKPRMMMTSSSFRTNLSSLPTSSSPKIAAKTERAATVTSSKMKHLSVISKALEILDDEQNKSEELDTDVLVVSGDVHNYQR